MIFDCYDSAYTCVLRAGGMNARVFSKRAEKENENNRKKTVVATALRRDGGPEVSGAHPPLGARIRNTRVTAEERKKKKPQHRH